MGILFRVSITSHHPPMQHYQLLCLILLICKGDAEKTYLIQTNGDTDAGLNSRLSPEAESRDGSGQEGSYCDCNGCRPCGAGLACGYGRCRKEAMYGECCDQPGCGVCGFGLYCKPNEDIHGGKCRYAEL